MNVMFSFVIFNYLHKKSKEQHLNYNKMTSEKLEDQIEIILFQFISYKNNVHLKFELM
jgi:hypothetical protein